MKIIFAALLILSVTYLPAQELTTPFEKSGGVETGTYQEVMLFYTQLAATSDLVKLHPMGQTDSGKPLHLITIDLDENHDPAKAGEEGKTIVLINNGIHPGEPDGIEASMMLARDLISPAKQDLLENTFLAIIPVYNIGGSLNRNSTSRVNQSGPKAYGFRGNARNYDLNRDFIKSDSRNSRSFQALFHLLKPDVFIDTHVSNGADYQYKITHLATQHDKIGGEMGYYIYSSFTPNLEKRMAAKEFPITPYVNVFNRTPEQRGFSQFLDNPRYSTGYTALFNTLGFMIETHMLKPFDERVKASYAFLESILEITREEGDLIRRLHNNIAFIQPGKLHTVAWNTDMNSADTITFLGYEGSMVDSEITGQKRLLYDRKQPFSKQIPYYNHFSPAVSIIAPMAYLIPQGWYDVIDLLKTNEVALVPLKNDTTMNVEAYRIKSYDTSPRAYEGHYPHSNTVTEKIKTTVSLRKGDFIAYVNQPSGRYLIETLEPEATDSFFNWNFFDTILQQKEGFSPYVFEDLAKELLENDDVLRIAFEKKKAEDEEFANSWYAQLNYIYENSPYKEGAHMMYPIFRLMP